MNFQGLPEIPSARRALAGFLVSGFLFALLGPLLPVWGYHIETDYITVGNYFLCLSAGMILAGEATRRLFPQRRNSSLLVVACALACVALLYLSLVSPPAASIFRMIGLVAIGIAVGLIHTVLFDAIRPAYQREPTATLNVGGIFFGLGCLASAVLVGAAFAYGISRILVLVSLLPLCFAILYSRSIPLAHALGSEMLVEPTLRQALRDFRSPVAVLFALLLFFQFGNEWSIAGWLPLFLIRRVGLSPQSAVLLLGLYWLSLLLGRIAVYYLLPIARRGRLLFAGAGAAVFGCVILLPTDNRFGAVTGILLVGCGFAPIYPLVAERIGRRFPYYHPGLFNGIFSFALAGGMLAPWVLGLLADALGIWVVMGLPLIGTCMVAILLLLIWLAQKVTGT